MIFVDSRLWIDYFNGKQTRETDFLDVTLSIEPATVMTIGGPEIAIRSAENDRFLKNKGATIRKTIDALIATRCIVDGYSLLHCDRDFQPFVDHLQLRSAI